MARLTIKERRKLPKRDFAGPGRSYPVPDKRHARAALSRASAAVKRGRLSKGQYRKIVRKADAKLRGGRRSKR